MMGGLATTYEKVKKPFQASFFVCSNLSNVKTIEMTLPHAAGFSDSLKRNELTKGIHPRNTQHERLYLMADKMGNFHSQLGARWVFTHASTVQN